MNFSGGSNRSANWLRPSFWFYYFHLRVHIIFWHTFRIAALRFPTFPAKSSDTADYRAIIFPRLSARFTNERCWAASTGIRNFSIRPVGQALGWVPKKSGWAGNSQSRNDLCLFGDLIACDKRFIRPRAQVALSNTRSLLYRYEVSSLRILLVSRS